MISNPPIIAAGVSGEFIGGGSNWSTMATMKIVRRAATEEMTGEVSDMRMRKDPENAEGVVSGRRSGREKGARR